MRHTNDRIDAFAQSQGKHKLTIDFHRADVLANLSKYFCAFPEEIITIGILHIQREDYPTPFGFRGVTNPLFKRHSLTSMYVRRLV
jgi:hypothetical protein